MEITPKISLLREKKRVLGNYGIKVCYQHGDILSRLLRLAGVLTSRIWSEGISRAGGRRKRPRCVG